VDIGRRDPVRAGADNNGDGWPSGGKADRASASTDEARTWPGSSSPGTSNSYGSNASQDARLNIIPMNTALAYPSLHDSMFTLLFTQALADDALTAGLFMPLDGRSSAAAAPSEPGIGRAVDNITPPIYFSR
jgi:hypothetical protein